MKLKEELLLDPLLVSRLPFPRFPKFGEKNMSNRQFIRFLSVTMMFILGAVLMACGSAPATKVPTPTKIPAATEVTASNEAAAPTETPATIDAPEATEVPTQEPIILEYWSMWNEDEPQGQVVKKAIDAYMADNPNVTVKVTWYGRDVRKLLGPALEAGQTVDVSETFAAEAKAHAMPLGAYLNKPALGPGNKEGDVSVRDVIFPALWNSSDVLNADGEVIAVPYNPYVVMMFYNKAHFQDANITKIPATWDEFIAAAQALKDAGHAPFTEDLDAYTDIVISAFAERAVTCPGIVDAVNDPTGESWKNDPNLRLLAEKVAEFAPYLADGTEGNLYPAGQQQVALGDVTMNLNGSWLPSELGELTGPDFPWGQFLFPDFPNGKGSRTHVESGSQALAINENTGHPDEAFELIRYIVGFDAQTAMTREGNSPAARVDTPWPAPLTDAYNAFKSADQSLPWACGLWDTGEVFNNVMLPIFKDLLLGKLTPDEFLDKMAKDQAEYWTTHKQ